MKTNKYHLILPLIALIAMIFAIIIVISMKPAQNPLPPPKEPFSRNPDKKDNEIVVSGTGIIESLSENIKIGTEISGIVEKVYVKTGDFVKTGDPLFKLDTALIEADIKLRQAQEDVTKADLLQAKSRLQFFTNIKEKAAISKEELVTRKNDVIRAEALVTQAQAQLNQAKTNLKLATVTAPIDGTILKINIRPGEFAQAGTPAQPLIIMGDTSQLVARIDIDEYDVSKLHQNSYAIISPKGNNAIKIKAKFLRMEPLLIPKRNLQGLGPELIDTRVIQLIYLLETQNAPLFVGQQVEAEIRSDKNAPLIKETKEEFNTNTKN